jgi:non-heme chloroperoxidase
MLRNNVANFFKTPDGEQIFYLKNFNSPDNTKPILLFNYGLVCSNHHWKYQVDFFDQAGYQIILHDYRGHFQSSGSEDVQKITFSQLALDISNLCHFLEVKQVILIGHSMGVNVCLQIAKDDPNLVHSMVLISGTFINVKDVMFDSNLMEFIAPLAVAGNSKYPDIVNKLWASGGKNPIIKELIHLSGFNRKKTSSEFVEIYLNRLGQLGADLFFQLFDQMTKQDITSSLEKMNLPVLVMGGHKDNVIPNHLQRTLASLLPKSESYFLKSGSHVPQSDFPEMINERIELFIKSKN